MKRFALTLLVAFAGGMLAVGLINIIHRDAAVQPVRTSMVASDSFTAQPAAYPMPSVPQQGAPDFVAAAEMTVNAVVHIKTEVRRRTSSYDDFFYEFFGRPQPQYNQPLMASGSGVIISDGGYIVTNNHVVQNAERIEVILNDKRSYEAEIVGTDPSTDLALVKINDENLPFLTYGNSDDVRVGEWVLAVGNPFNLTSTVTAGIVSAKARDINILGTSSAIESFIQTDAPVNRGNSGGALVNIAGQLIGINAAIASNTGSFTGYSFAIPVNIVKKVVNDFINYGEIQRAYIGVSIRDIDGEFAREHGLKDLHGVYVVAVGEKSSAADANIRPDDVIIQIQGVPVNSVSQLLEAVSQHSPGERINVVLIRGGKTMEKEVLLKNRENTYDLVSAPKSEAISKLGATFEPPSAEESANLGIDYGMKITELNRGKLMDRGIRQGFIITNIDKTPVRSIDDIKNLLAKKSGGVLIEGVYPNGQRAYYAIGL
jgi:Do/DeqQ family serine protease